MLDLKLIRERPREVEERLRRRDPGISLERLLELDRRRRDTLVEVEGLKSTRNKASDAIATVKREGRDASSQIAEMQEVSRRIKDLDERLRECEIELDAELVALPNLPHERVPASQRKEDKVILRQSGEKPAFDFPLKNHVELGKSLGILDFERAAKVTGAQFPMYVGAGARLEWALLQYLIDINAGEHGYTLLLPPYLVNPQSLVAAGNLPKFGDQLYHCEADDLYLIPTSEAVLTNLHRDETLDEAELPKNYCAYTANFRREAGTYGAGERGLIRVHQFNKVEMFKYTAAGASYDEFERLVADAEDLVRRLGLHYRVVLLPTCDIAQQAAMTVDIEVWLPAQGAYYEVSSCSNCEDYQARGANMRYRDAAGRLRYMHTLNGSGLATSRLMVAILETNQRPDGSVHVPEALQKYAGGMEVIGG
jgi:seryl-tRNA synthetase